MRVTKQAIAVLVLVLLLSLLGCRPPGAVRPTVKLGLVAPFEGRYRYVGYDVIYATRLALQEVNRAGGIGGYGVELVAYDDSAAPALAVAAARQLAVDSRVVAASGHFRPETTESALPVYAEAHLPLVSPLTPAPEAAPYLFPLGPSGEQLAEAFLARLADEDGRPFALVGDGSPPTDFLMTAAAVAVAPDETEWLTAVLSSGAGTVICLSPPVVAGEVLSALHSSGWAGEFLGGPELSAPAFAAVAGDTAGVAYVTPYPPPGEEFAAAYRTVSNGVEPGAYSVPAYEATHTLLAALAQDIAAHGVPSREGMASALATVMEERPAPPLVWR